MTAQRHKGVLILECLDGTDPGSEGRFLSHMFDIMEVDSQYVEVRTRRQFLAMLNSTPFQNIHIATHGQVTGRGESFKGFWTPDGVVRLGDFLDRSLHGCLVLSTACKSGSAPFARSL